MKMDNIIVDNNQQQQQQQEQQQSQKRSAADLIGSNITANSSSKYQCLQLNKNNNSLNISNKQYKSLPKYTKGISEEDFTKQILDYLDIDPKDIENITKIESIKIREGVYMNILARHLDYQVLKNWIEEAMTNKQWRVVSMLVVLSNSVSSFLVPSLIANLINARKDNLLQACLRTMNDISVGDQILIIKYCLESVASRVSLLNCVLWTSILLDSHFQEWMRTPEILEPYSEIIRNLQYESKLIGRSKAFIQSKLDSEQTIDANYSIHYFDL
ncbi:hypothetical protein PPL_08899 [Heterostelium album PN500]|uniref:Uncharacterized protein n=1 Tax=Heterostelium pallidum (strain ATCC 26659 / Pp 5 / PN500) TaxID=670386 RepID=D3BK18_HETP5|nr:hypothetical protein PPL_08899 [Heterostelium album PN500]EFA78248.1 hypothetical protein PPL_08899 [Heterostelium album PN500]|eukprot:XP_020430373.1 hypothetical protein PPL_08899 [Heterostelium album PN500]